MHPLLQLRVLSYSEVNGNNNNQGYPLLSVYDVSCAWLSALCITLSQLILTLTEFANQWLGGQSQPSNMFYLAHVVLAHIISFVLCFFFKCQFLANILRLGEFT